MKTHRNPDGERILAVFIDFENLALGFGGRRDKFSIQKVLERLVEKGKIVAKKAYADWSRFGNYAANLHAAAVELVEIPKRIQTGKNSADIRMCVDAMDLAYSKDHIDSFVIVSGDSDFSPLVSKLKELGKHVIGLGLVDSTSELLRDNCDEFIYYEDLDRVDLTPLVENPGIPEIKRKAFALLVDSLLALRRENKELIYSSMAKDTMKRKKPSFNEEYHGYHTFSELLEDAQRFGIIDLERHKASGTYVITRFGGEPKPAGGVVVGVVTRPALKVAEVAPPRALPEPAKREPTPEPRQDREPRLDREPRQDREPRGDDRNRRRNDKLIVTRPNVTLPPPVVPQPAPQFDMPSVAPKPSDTKPLGRELIDEVMDELDDEVPSYRPRKVAAKPASESAPRVKPAMKGEAKAEGKPASPRKNAAKPAGEEPPKPKRRVAVIPTPSVKPGPAKPKASKPEAVKPEAAKPAKGIKTRIIPPPPPPMPPAADLGEDDFGAGVL
ncbi:MAG: NYN domain-containing protein [Bacteroidales bacterium]|nr:NYN domain-containing protein [Bacteroidales bacterium]